MSQTGSPPLRYTSGVSNSGPGFLLGNLPRATPMRLNEYFSDFDTYATADWTVTAGSTGTNALIDGNGGWIALTTSPVDDDFQGVQLVKKSFLVTANSQMWFAINFKLSDATDMDFVAGYANALTSLTQTDGIYFKKLDGSTTLNLLVSASSTHTTIPVGTVATNTFYTVGFYYNGVDRLEVFSTIPYTTSTAATNAGLYPPTYFSGGNQVVNAAYSGGTYTLANLPTAALTMGFAAQAGSAAARVATVDYVYAAEEIVARY